MNEDFGIAVKVDPNGALPAIKKVEDGLNDAEKKAKELSRAASQAFAGVGDAMERELRLLEQVTGRSRDFGSELATLKRLHDQGRISAEQYIRTLQKMGVEMGQTADAAERLARANAGQAMNTIGLPTEQVQNQRTGKMADRAMGAAALATGAMHTVNGIQEHGRATETSYAGVHNAALKFAESGRDVNSILMEQGKVSLALRQPLSETLGLYDSINDATKDLGLSHVETIRLQTQLGKIALQEGQSLEQAGDVMHRLALAFASGADKGALLRKLMLDFGGLADGWIEKFGGSEKAFLSMVNDGKVGMQDLVDVTIAGNDKVDASWKKRIFTEEEWRQKASEVATMLEGKGMNALEAQKAGIEAANKAQAENVMTFREWGEIASAQLQRIGRKAEEEIGQKLVKFLDDAHEAGGKVDNAIRGIADAFMEDGFYVFAKLQDPWFVKPDAAKKIGNTAQAMKELREFNEWLNSGNGPQARTPLEQRDLSVTSGLTPSDIYGTGSADGTARDGISAAEASVQAQADEIMRLNGEAVSAAETLAKANEDAAQRTRDAWAKGLGSVAGDFLQMAMDGEKSISDMVEASLRKLALLGLQQAAAGIGGPAGGFLGSLFGALGGGRNGFDYVANSNWLQLPGFSRGGDGLIGGSGSQDSQLLMARVSSGESFHVRTPQQRMAEQSYAREADKAMRGGRGGGPLKVVVQMQNDKRDIVEGLDSRDGARVVAKIDRRMGRSRR